MIFKSSSNIIRVIKLRRMRWLGMWHVWERREMHTRFWLRDLKEGGHLDDPDGANIEMDLQEVE